MDGSSLIMSWIWRTEPKTTIRWSDNVEIRKLLNAFNEEEYLSFLENGFVIKPNFFKFDEVKLIKKETERLVSEGKFRNVATDEDGKESKSKQNLQLILQ